jgi:hypothetical protein
MKIIKAKVDWKDGWSNNPSLIVLVDKMPDRNILRYEEKDGLYYAQHEGYVNFFYYVQPNNGFGGRCFDIIMKDGSKEVLKGPWSSRASVANSAGFGPCIDVSITDSLKVWKRGYTFYSGSITVELVQEAIDMIDIGKGYGLVNNVGDWELNNKIEFPKNSRFCLKEFSEFNTFMPAVIFPDGTYWIKNRDRLKSRYQNKGLSEDQAKLIGF